MLRLRALSFLVGFPVVLAVCYFGGWPLFATVLFLALRGLYEWQRALAKLPARPNMVVATAITLAILLCTQFMMANEPQLNAWLVFIVVVAVAGSFIARVLFSRPESALLGVSTTLLTPLYIGLLFSFMLRLRGGPLWAWQTIHVGHTSFPMGSGIALMLFLICWVMDTGVFACGHLIGGPKLCPAISPGKTIAGFVGAVVLAAAATAAGFALLKQNLPVNLPVSWLWGVVVGALMGAFGQLGDLGKSLIKREVGVKDFGAILPGHGGILDRFDNVLFDVPLLFYALSWLMGKIVLQWQVVGSWHRFAEGDV